MAGGGATVQCPSCGAFERVGTPRCFSCGTSLADGADAPATPAAGPVPTEGPFSLPYGSPPDGGVAYGHPTPGAGPYPGPYGAPGAQPGYGGQAYGYGYPGYVQPKNEKGATTALVLAIVSFFFCGILLAPAAIVEGTKARRRIRESNGMLTGDGLAQAGFVLGIVSLIFNIVVLGFYLWLMTKTPARSRF